RHGFEQRVSPEVLALDKARSPEIPFRKCDGKPQGCPIGMNVGKADEPSILFWGDSHMLAWVPAIDTVLRRNGLGGRLMINSSCPPIFGAINLRSKSCAQNTNLIQDKIESGEFDAVVIAAYWFNYFPDKK